MHRTWSCPVPRALALGGALLLTAARLPAQEVKLDWNQEVDFARYKTFVWSPAQQPAKNPANHVRITRAVEQALVGKGMAVSTDGRPDAYLQYYARVGEKTKVTGKSPGAYWEPTNLRTTVDVGRVREGTLVLEMHDAEKREIVWRGVGTMTGVRDDHAEEDIKAMVKKLLEGYPPAKPAPAQP